MTEDGFPDDRLTWLVLRDVALFGNSEELKAFPRDLVLLTQSRLIREGYAIIIKGKSLRGNDTEVARGPGRGRLTDKGRGLDSRLRNKLREG